MDSYLLGTRASNKRFKRELKRLFFVGSATLGTSRKKLSLSGKNRKFEEIVNNLKLVWFRDAAKSIFDDLAKTAIVFSRGIRPLCTCLYLEKVHVQR